MNLFNRNGPLKGKDKKEEEEDKQQKGGRIPNQNLQNIEIDIEEKTPQIQEPVQDTMAIAATIAPPGAEEWIQGVDDMDIESDDDAAAPANNVNEPQFQMGNLVRWRNDTNTYRILHVVARGADGIWAYRIGRTDGNGRNRFAQEDDLTLLPQQGGEGSCEVSWV